MVQRAAQSCDCEARGGYPSAPPGLQALKLVYWRIASYVLPVEPELSGAVRAWVMRLGLLLLVFLCVRNRRQLRQAPVLAIGVVAGFLVLQIVNVLRIAGLGLSGIYLKDYFHYIHIYVAQGMMIAVALVLFLVWLNYATQK